MGKKTRFTNKADQVWFDKTLDRIVEEEVMDTYVDYVSNKDPLFASFLR